jgi:hypothetical protein
VEAEEHIPEMWVVSELKMWKIFRFKGREGGGDNRRLKKLHNEDFMVFIPHH